MSAEVIAIGPFRRDLVPYLLHPAERYATTRDGATIVERVFETSEGNTRSRALAACFGVDPWDFKSHALDADHADLEVLRAMFRDPYHGRGVGAAHDDVARSGRHPVDLVDKLVRLRDAGFAFFFRPNG